MILTGVTPGGGCFQISEASRWQEPLDPPCMPIGKPYEVNAVRSYLYLPLSLSLSLSLSLGYCCLSTRRVVTRGLSRLLLSERERGGSDKAGTLAPGML